MSINIAPLAGAAISAIILAVNPAFGQEVGKYCAVYKDGKVSTGPVISSASLETCKTRAASAGGDGYGLACQGPKGEILVTAKTATDAAGAPDATWQDGEDAVKAACSKMWGIK